MKNEGMINKPKVCETRRYNLVILIQNSLQNPFLPTDPF
jgi:hypothetical protein